MTLRIHILVHTLIFLSLSAESQKISKSDKVILTQLQAHIQSLSADTAGGLGMGMPGEKATADYIVSELSKAGVRPKGDNNGWLQHFTIDQGRQVGADALLSIDDKTLVLNHEWYPLAISPAGQVSGSPAIALPESGVPWFVDLREMLDAGAASPH
jgi:aminopeptidase YwaD